MAYAFYLGIDITDEEDGPAATLSLVEKETDDPQGEAQYHVRAIERMDGLGGEGPSDDAFEEALVGLATRVQNLLVSEPQEVGHSIPVVNATGRMGQAVLQAVKSRGLTPIGITLTGGEAAAQGGSGLDLEGGDTAADDDASFFVSEADLAGRIVRLETQGRLTIEHESTRHASELAHGLQSWRARVDTSEQTEEAEALGEEAAAGDVEATDEAVTADGEAGRPQDAVTADEADPAERPVGGAPEGQEPGETGTQAPRGEAHDAFVISAALACWLGEERSFDPTEHLGGEAPTTGEAKRMHRPDLAD